MARALTTPAERPDIAGIAALFADRSRAAVLVALLDGRALPAGQLAAEAGVAASTVSEHLTRLTDAGLLAVEISGRHRYYRIARPEVADLIELLTALSPAPAPVNSLRGAQRMGRLRRARSCYDHCAGELGTELLRRLVEWNALVRTDGHEGTERALGDRLSAAVSVAPYAFGPASGEVFGGWGIDVDAVRRAARPAIRVCVDWTEQRHHLAGGLGAAVLTSFLDRGWVRRTGRPRELELTGIGAAGLRMDTSG